MGEQALFEQLRLKDPVAAERMDGRNIRRTIRAWSHRNNWTTIFG